MVKVNITFVEMQDIVVAENYTLTQGSVRYINRPRSTQSAFPAIAARTMISKGENSSIGPWVVLPYNGAGIYSFNIGFKEGDYPMPNDIIHISIYVLDKEGERIGAVVDNIVWR